MKKELISIDKLSKVLTPKEMKNITGGSYRCFCSSAGFFNVYATSCSEALEGVSWVCGDYGGGCFCDD